MTKAGSQLLVFPGQNRVTASPPTPARQKAPPTCQKDQGARTVPARGISSKSRKPGRNIYTTKAIVKVGHFHRPLGQIKARTAIGPKALIQKTGKTQS